MQQAEDTSGLACAMNRQLDVGQLQAESQECEAGSGIDTKASRVELMNGVDHAQGHKFFEPSHVLTHCRLLT